MFEKEIAVKEKKLLFQRISENFPDATVKEKGNDSIGGGPFLWEIKRKNKFLTIQFSPSFGYILSRADLLEEVTDEIAVFRDIFMLFKELQQKLK